MGYIGSKMSVRAYEAYESGEKPLSKWSKNDIIECVLNVRNDFNEKELNSYNKEVLKVFLICSSWHHTGSYFNETNFYSLDHDFIELSKSEIILVLEKKKKDLEKEKEEKKSLKLQKCLFKYIEWAGTRKHPKAIEKESYGIIKGSWIYYKDGKKSLNGKYIHVVEVFERAPRGTAALFKQIEKDL